ncbi:hypothetical protein ACWGHM_01260 [Streptomyces sp. NPDC054904]|uniref:hypothetical protein n=1 Tax=unclassified Streptomyces TaxID=2593676 RepID=UPI002481A600|nr:MULTISPECIES: hypothetical protein [unclassified Streptomyces]MDA5280161.1 hypothetical protein [Streptomyces sp. Isolate_45]MDX2389158.1 hypothetical protein [Streptomyces sp. DK15]
MSDSSIPPSARPEPSAQPDPAGKSGPAAPPEDGAPATGPRRRAPLGRLVPRSNGARWAALGVAVVVVGGGVAALAVAEHHHDRAERPRFARIAPGVDGPGERRAEAAPGHGGPGERRAAEAPPGRDGQAGPKEHRALGGPEGQGARGGSGRTAPAPLPSLPIGDAAGKAAAAVTGGKVESLRVVAQDGGGSAWLAVVLGPDGVRHAVTVSGTDGTVTGNTPVAR